MKSLIFGYGITGQSFERYLTKKGKAFEIYDENVKGPNIFNILPDLAQLSSYEMIYLSPGINLQKLYTKEESSNCLLYTSPSPRDQRGSRMPSSA